MPMPKKEFKMATTVILRTNPIFSKSMTLDSDLLENCSIFGTTIFLDWRKNAPIGENGF